MRRATFAQAAMGAGASALNRVFERYLVPITFSSEHLHLHIAYNDVDPSVSPIWYDDNGNVLAAALFAIRGKRAWIGGFGVAPEHRSRGYGKQLLETLVQTARDRGIETIQLEVLADNLPAIRAYRNARFERIRVLRSFEHFVEDIRKPAGYITAAIEDFINAADPAPPCWQRERSTLRNGAVSAGVTDTQGNYALFRFNAQGAQVLKLDAHDAESLNRLAHAIAAGRDLQSILILNEPAESRISQFSHEAGWNEPFIQYEMRLTL
jgi:ribosomal protein S18 acetylase RimI-like enzyme